MINAFSAIVSNAEFIRTQGGGDTRRCPSWKCPGPRSSRQRSTHRKVARKLIDWARRATAVEGGQAGPESPVVDLNQLVREKLDSEMSIGVRPG